MFDIVDAWRAAPAPQKRKAIAAVLICAWAGLLTADMYYLQQRPEFQEKFGTKKDEGGKS